MLAVWTDLYQILCSFSEYIIDGKRKNFMEADLWKNSLELEKDLSIKGRQKDRFYRIIERKYETKIPDDIKDKIITLGDLKEVLVNYSEIAG